MTPTLGLIVCTYRRPAEVARLLQALAAQARLPDEVSVIDASPDGETALAVSLAGKTWPGPRLTYHAAPPEHRGLTRQRNLGLARCLGEFVAFLDDDTVPEPGYFAEVLACFDRHPQAVGVGGYITNEVSWTPIKEGTRPGLGEFHWSGWSRREDFRWRLRRVLGLAPSTPPGWMPPSGHGRSVGFLPRDGSDHRVEFVMGGASTWRRRIFDRQAFSTYFEGYGLYEDLEFCLRADAEGPLFLCTTAGLEHHHAPTGRPAAFRYGTMVVRNGWYVWRRRWPKPAIADRVRWWATTAILAACRLGDAIRGPHRRQALAEAFGRAWGMVAPPWAESHTTVVVADAPDGPKSVADGLSSLTLNGVEFLVRGEPDREVLARQAAGPGDLWHGGLERGCAGLLHELRYWNPVDWFYLNDSDPSLRSVSWRVDASAFAVRREAWERFGGFDRAYTSETGRGLDLGFRLLQNQGIPLHVPGLFPARAGPAPQKPPREDVYLFFHRHFKRAYRLYMLTREVRHGHFPPTEWRAMRRAERAAVEAAAPSVAALTPRPLAPLPASARVTVIVPTLGRRETIGDFLNDLARQTLPPHQVIVIDQARPEERNETTYQAFSARLPLQVVWHDRPGACLARNAGIRLATGEFIVFADDDLRVRDDYLESHVRFLETYGVEAGNGLTINASRPGQGLAELDGMIEALGPGLREVRAATHFASGNSCVRRPWVEKCHGFDRNFEGGFWEDTDFGMRLVRQGAVVLNNPHAAVLHLKFPRGGFRWWQARSNGGGSSPWQEAAGAGRVTPRPSPTVMYGFLKHGDPEQLREWRLQYLARSWWPKELRRKRSRVGMALGLLSGVLATPMKLLRMRESLRIATRLLSRGPRHDDGPLV